MILTDTGPIVALADQSDPHRQQVERAFAQMQGPMTTTDACVTEALCLLYRGGGWNSQDILQRMFSADYLRIFPTSEADVLRALEYMKRFRDQPCDYADATILVAAEDSGRRSVFTLDKHFYAYRLTNGNSVEVLPYPPHISRTTAALRDAGSACPLIVSRAPGRPGGEFVNNAA